MYKKSRSFSDLCPSSFKATGQTEVKLYNELSWDKGSQIYQNGFGHMTKMAAIPIYGKNL